MTGKQDKNFSLSEKEFDELREGLSIGNEQLFEHIFLRHFALCRDYLVVNDAASPEDAYDATMDALIKLRTGIGNGTIAYGNLRYLFTLMARQFYFKSVGKSTSELPAGLTQEAEEVLQIEPSTYQLLATGWKQLEMRCREILSAIYFSNRRMVDIASEEDVDPATIRKQKERCVKRLRKAVAA